eukprot:3172323-Amphidinium_carterae.1
MGAAVAARQACLKASRSWWRNTVTDSGGQSKSAPVRKCRMPSGCATNPASRSICVKWHNLLGQHMEEDAEDIELVRALSTDKFPVERTSDAVVNGPRDSASPGSGTGFRREQCPRVVANDWHYERAPQMWFAFTREREPLQSGETVFDLAPTLNRPGCRTHW